HTGASCRRVYVWCLGAALLVLFALPMALIGLAILAESGWPALIRQRRIGRNGNEYLMLKFRTLPRATPDMSKANLKLAGREPSGFGRVLRRYRLDELPQLVNVIGGSMSLVGPRPALYTQNDLVDLRWKHGVLSVKPGMTGLAQVRGGEDLPLEQKVLLDA